MQTDALSSHVPVDDETAKAALQEFFGEVYRVDGANELRRMYDAFYFQCHSSYPERDFSDKAGDGALEVTPPAMAASNGR